MEQNIIDKIITKLENNIPNYDGDKALFSDKGYMAHEIKKDNFKEIKTKTETSQQTSQRIVFVDGGNAEIIGGSNFSLQLIRVYYCIFKDNKKIYSRKIEFFTLISSFSEKGKIVYKAEFFCEKEQDKIFNEEIYFDSFEEGISDGKKRGLISRAADAIRRFSEIKMATKSMETVAGVGAGAGVGNLKEGDFIVLDGTLEQTFEKEGKYLDELYEKSKEKKIVVSGLCKSSRIFTEKGNSLIGLINEISPKGAWKYHPVVEITNPLHKADLFILKLNKNSKYVFRFEIFKESRYDLEYSENMISSLAEISKDPVFLGYPYGLIDADQFARISNHEKNMLKTKTMIKSGKKWEKIEKYQSSTNAHGILDNIKS